MVSVLDTRPTMLPPEELLTDVLPTDRLTATGMPVPELRTELRRIDDLRNAGTVVATWAAGPRHHRAGRVDRPPARLRRGLRAHGPGLRPLRDPRPRGRPQAAVHQQALERLPWAAGWSPTRRSCRSTPTAAATSPTTRTSSGPNEPDLNLYNGYPITEASFRRKMWRDARGTSGWKNLKGLLQSLQEPGRPSHRDRGSRHAAAADRGGHRRRALVALPAAVARPVADVVARDQPAAVDRRARRDDALEGPSPDDPPRAADLAGPVLDGAAQHRLAPRPPRRHGRAVAQPPQAPRRARGRRLRHPRAHLPELPRPVAQRSRSRPEPAG